MELKREQGKQVSALLKVKDVGGGKLAYLPYTKGINKQEVALLENFKEQLLRVEKYFKENFL